MTQFFPFKQHVKTSATKPAIGASDLFADLIHAGFPLPAGYILPPVLFETFLEENALQTRIRNLISTANPQDIASLSSVSHSISQLIMHAPMPQKACDAILVAFVKLSNKKMMLHATVSGQIPLRAYGFSGEANAIIGVRHMWSSLFSPHHIREYIQKAQVRLPAITITVQPQPTTTVSGILYTIDSRSSNKHACIVEAVFGEGGFIQELQGKDTYTLNKEDGLEITYLHEDQENEFIAQNGVFDQRPTGSKQPKRKLSPDSLPLFSQLAKDIQQHLFFPQEVLWAFDGNRVWVVDTKPMEIETEFVHTQTTHLHPTSQPLVTGIGKNPGIVTGRVRVIRTPKDNAQVKPGDIVVTPSLHSVNQDVFKKARGLVIEEDVPSPDAMMYAGSHGVATLVGARNATSILSRFNQVTLHSARGSVTLGNFEEPAAIQPKFSHHMTATKIGIEVSLLPKSIPKNIEQELNGHILVHPEELIALLGHHPEKLHKQSKTQVLEYEIVQAALRLTKETQAPLLYKLSNFTTLEYSQLSGGTTHETHPEANPLMGYHGALRFIANPKSISIELEALKTLRVKHQVRLGLAIPSLRFFHELTQVETILNSYKVSRSAGLLYFLYLNIPSMLWQIEECVRIGIDGIVLDLDALAGYLFALDPHNAQLSSYTQDQVGVLFAVLKDAISTSFNLGIRVIVTGKKTINDAMLEYIIGLGVHEILIAPASVLQVKQRVLFYESQKQ